MGIEVSEKFKSRSEALKWLNDNGYKVSTGKFYQDCKAGKLVVSDDGSISRYQVLMYGLALKETVAVDPEFLDKREYEHRKAKADAEMAEIKAERMRREADRQWLHADDAWAAVAWLVGRLRDAIRHQLHTGQRDVVFACGGDQERSAEAFELLDSLVDKAFNEVAGEKIEIEFMEDES